MLKRTQIELEEKDLRVTLRYSDTGIVVEGKPVDRVLAKKELRSRGMIVAD